MPETQRLASPAGVSVEISSRWREITGAEITGAEVGRAGVVAAVDPWPWPEAFRPHLTLETRAASPSTATIAQLSSQTIAAQIALGRHVVACDATTDARDGGARRLISVYSALERTVVQLQHVAIVGGRGVIVTMQAGVGNLADGQRTFEHAVATLECQFDESPAGPDSLAQPSLDDFALRQGRELEDVSGIRAMQSFATLGPRLDDAQLAALLRGKLGRRLDRTPLEQAGLVSDRGRLTELGEAAHQALRSPQRKVAITVAGDGNARVASFEAHQRTETTALIASAPPRFAPTSAADHGSSALRTLEVIATGTTAVAIVRWLGVAPAWSFGISDDSLSATVDPALLEARLRNPGAPVPAGANRVFERMWRERWLVTTLEASYPPRAPATIVMTARSGMFLVERRPSEGKLSALVGLGSLTGLLAISGFDLSP